MKSRKNVNNQMSECNVCAESFNKTKRAKVVCRCNYEACRTCIKTYLLDRSEDAHCMSCKIGWDRAFMSESFEKTFMAKEYRDHREKILIEREIGMLQATQPYVEREIKLEKLDQAIIDLQMEYSRKRQELNEEIYEVRGTVEVERRKFIRKCPSGDCHGFLSSGLKCELCENFACGDCHETTGKTTEERETHICDPQIVESVKAIAKDSKPCPNCACITFKIIGCDEMFCVECHKAWNWKTQKLLAKSSHNPEYFDWLKKNIGQVPRDPNEIRCGREIDSHFINTLFDIFPRKMANGWKEEVTDAGGVFGGRIYYRNNISKLNQWQFSEETESGSFTEIARNIIHIRQVEMRKFNAEPNLQVNLQMRINYMRNKIEKDDFKKKLQKQEKDNQKKHEITNVLVMYTSCMTDIFYKLVDKPKTKEIIKDEMKELRIYVNNSLNRISKTYNSKSYEINNEFVWV